MSGDVKENVSSTDSIRKCPICGGNLEQGYLGVFRVLSWDKEKHSWMRGQENLANYWNLNNQNFHALRCLNCHIVIFDYQNKE